MREARRMWEGRWVWWDASARARECPREEGVRPVSKTMRAIC